MDNRSNNHGNRPNNPNRPNNANRPTNANRSSNANRTNNVSRSVSPNSANRPSNTRRRRTKDDRGLLRRIFDFAKKKDAEDAEKKPFLGIRGRQMFILMCVIGFSMFVGYHLLKFTVLDGDKWLVLANRQQMSELTIKANRGTIYDANGSVLAQSSTVWDIIIAPTPIYRENKERREAYDKRVKKLKEGESIEPYVELSDLISNGVAEILGISPDGMLEACKDYDDSYYVTVKRKVEKPEVTQINKFLSDNNISSACLYAEESSKRYYPSGSLASTVIGFTNYDGYGVYGLEAYYDEYLRGTDGKAFYIVDGQGQAVEYRNDNYFSAVDGNSLVLTLDEVMQHYLEKNLELTVSQYDVINRATGIMMNCKTGGVVAMATVPSFDLNDPSEIVGDYAKGQLEALKASGASEDEIDELEASLREQQWKNKAVVELYYPGSVFKTVSCAAGLDTEVIDMNSTFTCEGGMDVAGQYIHCWNWGGHGTLTTQGAITKSCNPAFMQIGAKLGVDRFSSYYEAFGFTRPTGIDLPGEADSIFYTRDKMGPVELATSAFGQSNKITPIQMCTAICALVNGGNLVTPHLVDKILDSNGNVIETIEPQIKRQVISEETSKQMRTILETIVSENGGTNAYIEGYRIGGKSGTAEKIDEYNAAGGEAGGATMHYIATFAAAVLMDDPEIVMLIAIDTPTGGSSYYGSAVAAPVVSAVFSEGLEHMGIYPTYTAEEQAKMDSVVPYVIGQNSMRAQSALIEQGFEVKIVGDNTGSSAVVTNQIPYSGMSVPKGSTVVLYMGGAESEMAVVPNVVGMNLSSANLAITDAGFNIKVVGGAASNADATAVSQSVAAESTLEKGSVIEVTFRVDTRDN